MVQVDPIWQNILFAVFAISWFGGAIVLFFRMRITQNAYLRRFEHEIDFFVGDPIFFPRSFSAYRRGVRMMRQWQADPDLEELRRAMWRRYFYSARWIFGYPILVYGVAAVLIVTGVLRLLP